MCDAILIGNTQQKIKKSINVYLSDGQRILKNIKNSDSLYALYKQHFKSTTSRTDLHMFMVFKSVKKLNTIVAVEIFMKPNCSLFTKERLTIPQNIRDRRVKFSDKRLKIYGAC